MKKHLIRILAALLAGVAVLCSAACTGAGGNMNGTTELPSESGTTEGEETTTEYQGVVSKPDDTLLTLTAEQQALAADLKGLSVLAIGDSLFDGDFLEGRQQWIALLAKACGWNLTNLGRDGWTVAHNPEAYADPAQQRPSMVNHLLKTDTYHYGSMGSYLQFNKTPSFSANQPNEVDMILLEGGTNDFGWGIPLGEVDSTDIGTLYGAFNTMIEHLLVEYPHARIVLITSWHVQGTRAKDGASRMDFVANALKNIKATHYPENERVALIDAGDPAVSGVDMTSYAFKLQYSKSVNDGNHLNADGMKLAAVNLLPHFHNLMVKEPQEKYDALCEKLKGLNVLAIGDSLTDGHAVKPAGQWMGLLAKDCAWNMTNLGRGARTVAHNSAIYPNESDRRESILEQLFRYTDTFCYNTCDPRYTHFGNTSGKSNEDVDLVFLQGGVNDFQVNMPLGEIDSTYQGELIGAWRTIIGWIMDWYPNAKIVLITTWRFDETRDSDGANRTDFSQGALKRIYAEYYADDERVSLIDAGDPLVSRVYMEIDTFRKNFCESPGDTHHLNAKGMEMMAKAMLPLLAEILVGEE